MRSHARGARPVISLPLPLVAVAHFCSTGFWGTVLPVVRLLVLLFTMPPIDLYLHRLPMAGMS